MKLSKVCAVGLVALCVAGSLYAGGGKQSGSTAAPKAITIRVGDNWADNTPMAMAIDQVFKPEIEKASNGQLVVEVYHSGQLGNEAELWNQVRNGTVEITVPGSVMNTEWSPMLISDWPFLYRDIQHAKKVWTDSDIPVQLNKEFHDKFPTTYLLSWGPNSARTFTSNKPLTTPEDFQGQKFRMPSNEIHVGITQDLGASAQVIPLNELFSALETGIVDGQDNGMVTVRGQGFYEVQKYLYETNHIIATLEIIVNAGFYDKLTADQQKILADAAQSTAVKAWDLYINSLDADRQFLRDNGMTVTQTTPDDQAAIQQAIQPTLDKLFSKYDWAKGLTERVKAVR
ncbi:MAG: TRAP transporter substrate-binding protein [Treponema sp.]|nr:TRAP transporter substrate-binding protein [Treponema sp.]